MRNVLSVCAAVLGVLYCAYKVLQEVQAKKAEAAAAAGGGAPPSTLPSKAKAQGAQPITLELHGYQRDFLETLGKEHDGSSGALQAIVDRALTEEAVRNAIFEDLHCIHCGSVSPEPWIAKRKGDKQGVAIILTAAARELLASPVLVTVEKRGEPPTKQVVKDGPKRSDASKAARCAVDWAIKDSGALKHGKPTTAE